MRRKYLIFLLTLFFSLCLQTYCILSLKADTLKENLKIINGEAREAKKEYRKTIEKIKIKRYLLIQRLDKKDSGYKKDLREIKTQISKKIKAAKGDWINKYKSFKEKRRLAKVSAAKYRAVQRSLNLQEKALKIK